MEYGSNADRWRSRDRHLNAGTVVSTSRSDELDGDNNDDRSKQHMTNLDQFPYALYRFAHKNCEISLLGMFQAVSIGTQKFLNFFLKFKDWDPEN